MNTENFIDEGYNANLTSILRVAALNNDREYIQLFVDSVEQSSGPVFYVSPMTADINFIRGDTSLYLTQSDETFSILAEGSSSSINVSGGNHDILFSAGELDIAQSDGNITLYIDDFFNTTANIEIGSGSFKLAINDPALELNQLSIDDGFITLNGSQTGISFEFDQSQEHYVSIENLLNGDELLLENIIAPDTEASNLVAETNGQINDAQIQAPTSEGSSDGTIPATHDLLFGEDVSSELIYQDINDPETYIHSNLVGSPQFISGFDSDFSFAGEDFFSEYLNLELNDILNGEVTQEALESLKLPSNDHSVAKLDIILEVDSYDALAWEDAIEIISDI